MNNSNIINVNDDNNDALKEAFVGFLGDKFLKDMIDNRSMAIAEETLIKDVMKYARYGITQGLENLDEILHKNKSNELKVKSIEKRTLETLAGLVSFKRRKYYKNNKTSKKKKSLYLLDKAVGILKKSKLSVAFTKILSTGACKTSYRGSIIFHRAYTNSFISAPTVKKALENTSLKVQNEIDKRKIETNKNIEIVEEKIKTDKLTAEADGVYIHLQRKKGFNKSEKRKGMNMDVFKVYEGKDSKITNSKTQKYKTKNTKVYACMTKDKNKFTDDVYAGFLSKYDYDYVEKSYIGTDGEKKYKELKDIMPNMPKCKTIHILDKWHIMDRLNIFKHKYPNLKRYILKYIYSENNIDKAIRLIKSQINRENNKSWIKKLESIKTYFENNKSSINANNISLGTIESTNSHLIGSRLKNYGGAWSIKGANNMGICLSTLSNDKELPYLTDKEVEIEKELLNSIPKYMSVNKSLKLEPKYPYFYKTGKLTGTKAIKDNFVKRWVDNIPLNF